MAITKRGLYLTKETGERIGTAENEWTMTSLTLSEPLPKENLVEVPGRDGPGLDLALGLTNGYRKYGSRNLEATFVCSEFSRDYRRLNCFKDLVAFHGFKGAIEHPDYPGFTLYTNCLNVREDYHTNAQAGLTISAVCEPFFVGKEKSTEELSSDNGKPVRSVLYTEHGQRAVLTKLIVAGDGSVSFTAGGVKRTFDAGTHYLHNLIVLGGGGAVYITLSFKGSATAKLSYSEQVI